MERRIRIVGLCLIAVFVLGAVVATTAQAGVELGKCGKVVKTGQGKNGFKGRYKDKICSKAEEATPEEIGLGGEKNKYEWHPGAGGNGTFTGKGKEIKITTGSLEVVCKTGSATGAIRGAQTLEVTFKFNTCQQPKNEKKKCGTHGKELGEILSDKLLGQLSEGPKKEPLFTFAHLKAGVQNPEEPWMEFECIEKKFTVTQSLSGKSTQAENVMTKKGGIEFSELVGEQDLIAEFPNPFNSEETEKEPLKIVFGQTFKYEASYELRTT